MRTRLGVVQLPLAVLAVIASGAPWLHAFAASDAWPVLIGAAVFSVAIPAIVTVQFRRNIAWSAAASALAFVLFAVLAVLRSTDPGDLIRGFTTGTSRLLSTTLPVSGNRWMMIVPAAVTWCTGAVLGEMLVRTRASAATMVVPFAAFAGAVATTAGAEGSNTGAAVALFVLASGLLCLRRWLLDAPATESQPTAGHRGLVVGAVGVVTITLVAGIVVPRVDHLQGTPAAPARAIPLLDARFDTPIATATALRAAAARDDEPLFDVTFDGDASGYVALATLDHYDGSGWAFDRSFEPTGGRIPIPEYEALLRGAERSTDLHQSYRVRRSGLGPWLPSVPLATAVAGVAVRYDPTTGMLLPRHELAADDHYEVTSRAPMPLANAARDARAAIGAGTPADYSYPQARGRDLDNWITALATKAGERAVGTPQFLAALEAVLRSEYSRVDDTAAPKTSTTGANASTRTRGGTSFADVAAALASTRATPEQFATIYALVARRLGVPARVVTGFRLSPIDAAPAMLPAGRYEVRPSAAWTWVEVPVTGRGWVVVDPTPATTSAVEPETGSAQSSTTTLPPEPGTPAQTGDQGIKLAPPSASEPVASTGLSRTTVAGAIGAFAVALVAFVLGAVAVRKRVRRSRRRRGNPSERAVGAWHDAIDVLYEAGVDGIAAATATEIAAEAGTRFGPLAHAHAMQLAQVANQALFSPIEPDEHDVEASWHAAQALRGEIRRALPASARVRRLVRVAPASITR